MDSTFQNAYNRVVSTNPLYQRNRERWMFLLQSYIGGNEYRSGGHLTKYVGETTKEYEARLSSTPLDNHCRSVISVYTSFMFRSSPERDFGTMPESDNLKAFLEDADLDGRSMDAFMRDVAIWAAVFGHCWILTVKPQTNSATRADEMAQGVRPYVNLITPLTVTDWTWKREASGAYSLTYLKYVEETNDSFATIKEWTQDIIITSQVNNQSREITDMTEEVNELGRIPAVIAYAARSPIRGFGASMISDIADAQRMIYNMTSEVEQSIRINGHPTLVKTTDVEASAGAGSIALMPDGMDPGLKPYLLNVSTDITQIYTSIDNLVNSIDKMANTGAIRATESRTLSGVAMETEFQLLNARLAEFADNLELAEEQIWRWYALYEGTVFDGEIDYPDEFSVRDVPNALRSLQTIAGSIKTPESQALLEFRVRELLDDPRYEIQYEEEREQAMYQAEIDEINKIQATLESAAPVDAQAAPTEPTANFPDATCPIATQDIGVNLANRQTAIDTAKYGPLNPALPNTVFWMAKADMWNTDVATAKQSLCGNCSFFNMTTPILDCIDAGLTAGGATGDEWDSVGGGQLGYCEAFDFKCKSTRTCDAWVAGGPVTDVTPTPAGAPE
ncbi:Portal protein [uncultured Caudovirales phage]|uniref:Portal protein n=1 Tax=uncultured Caudovirales phage TaxID=2100421 RepID=A0A6J5N8S4_9CAUD|nr:Portal protein [uncultured Caudovirales phage]CAB5226096.1 Portal protein [uncultured Caudovirales phage]